MTAAAVLTVVAGAPAAFLGLFGLVGGLFDAGTDSGGGGGIPVALGLLAYGAAQLACGVRLIAGSRLARLTAQALAVLTIAAEFVFVAAAGRPGLSASPAGAAIATLALLADAP